MSINQIMQKPKVYEKFLQQIRLPKLNKIYPTFLIFSSILRVEFSGNVRF